MNVCSVQCINLQRENNFVVHYSQIPIQILRSLFTLSSNDISKRVLEIESSVANAIHYPLQKQLQIK